MIPRPKDVEEAALLLEAICRWRSWEENEVRLASEGIEANGLRATGELRILTSMRNSLIAFINQMQRLEAVQKEGLNQKGNVPKIFENERF